ncbi:LOW QUALITY PROTEIN: uncharacterized protein MICPUCDRAFT_67229 [Micromonas pusilla CCMP1545]|uniref:Predicted protein n=1 Tax=Micromonas pusilla (strain CCMP1545) TaxID=564608 RepID=C1MQ32_MICPC|nr:LOW QUALITY PROTEIN: uncharacterized protein MICPUCDRAFT_67229 [Micromonas pusilla CCMP1545]EEH57640.1 predicted protein [Micromonas pusilla CCMP1545]|eukprot:XP_003057689.1 predicted protein [Micromonas pusilla CCMP1545]
MDPDAQDVEGRTALFFASANGHLEIVDILLASKADPTMTNAQGNTALHWACVNGHEDVVVRLLRRARSRTWSTPAGERRWTRRCTTTGGRALTRS